MKMKSMMLSGAFATMVLASPTLAEPVRLGVLTDMSGMNFDLAGDGSVVAAKMAVEDFGGKLNGELSKSSLEIIRISLTSGPLWHVAGSMRRTSRQLSTSPPRPRSQWPCRKSPATRMWRFWRPPQALRI